MAAAGVALALAIGVAHRSRLASGALLLMAAGCGVEVANLGGVGPVAALVLGVVVAFLVVGGDVRLGGAHQTPVSLAIPLVVAAGSVWVRTASPSEFVALLAVAVLLVVSARLLPALAARLEATVRSVVSSVAAKVAAVALFVVVLVSLYLGGFLARLAHAAVSPLRGPQTTAWSERGIDVARSRRDAPFPFGSTPPGRRTRRTMVGLCVVAALLLGDVAISRHYRRTPRVVAPPTTAAVPGGVQGPGPVDELAQVRRSPYRARPAFRNSPDRDALQAEMLRLVLPADDVTGFRLANLRGRWVNVQDGQRQTPGPTCRCPAVDLWLFGGSAAFGVGQRDDHTIAADLVQAAARRGIGLRIRNFGVPGWTISQQRRALVQALSSRGAPDLVVFLGGFDDVFGLATASAVRGKVQRQAPTDGGVADLATFSRQRLDVDGMGGGQVIGVRAAQAYARAKVLVDAQAARAGFVVHHFFQPDALTSPRQRAALFDLYGFDPGLFGRADADRALEVASRRLEPGVTDLRHVLDAEAAVVFGDVTDVNEAGARVVAAAMFDRLLPSLRHAAQSSHRCVSGRPTPCR